LPPAGDASFRIAHGVANSHGDLPLPGCRARKAGRRGGRMEQWLSCCHPGSGSRPRWLPRCESRQTRGGCPTPSRRQKPLISEPRSGARRSLDRADEGVRDYSRRLCCGDASGTSRPPECCRSLARSSEPTQRSTDARRDQSPSRPTQGVGRTRGGVSGLVGGRRSSRMSSIPASPTQAISQNAST
jgi:hypothetical protein